MKIISKLVEQLESKFGKGIRHPVSKLNSDMEKIVKHQNKRMLVFEEYPETGPGATFLRELEKQFEEMEALRRQKRISRKDRYPAFKLLWKTQNQFCKSNFIFLTLNS